MKLLIQYPYYSGIGGISRYLENFLNSVSNEKNLKIILLTSQISKNKKIPRNVKIIVVPLKNNRFSLIKWALRSKRIIEKLYVSNDIDLVNCHIPPLIPGLTPANVPYIITAHGSLKLHESGKYDNFVNKTVRFVMERKIFRNAKKIIVLTNQVRKELTQYNIPKTKITICPNGVDVYKFKPSTNVKKDIDVLFIGRLVPEKGSKFIPQLCKKMIQKKKNIKICIIGSGSDYAFIKNSLKNEINKKNVRLLGEVKFEKVSYYYQRSKIYVSCSNYEGLPGTCLEAMSVSLPIVGWDKAFYKKLIYNNKNGFAIKNNSIEIMNKKIIHLLNHDHLMKKMGTFSRSIVVKQYYWKKISKKILSVMEEQK